MKKTPLIIIICMGLFLVSSCVQKQEISPAVKDKPKIKTATKPAVTKPSMTITKGNIVVDGKVDDWDAAGITVLEGLDWKNIYSMPMMGDDFKRIKSVRIAYDAKNLYLLFEIKPGVEEYFYKKEASGHIAYLYLDADGKESTGARRHIEDKYSGWDYRIYLPTGFIGKPGEDAEPVKPAAWYEAERIKSYSQVQADYGITSNCEYEDVPGGRKASYDKPAYIAFQGDFLEVGFPFEVYGIVTPTEVKLVIDDLGALPNAEVKINGFFEKPKEVFYISYFFSAEAFYNKIEIDKSKLIYTYFEDSSGKCDNWLRSEPCWTWEDLKTRKTDLSENQINDLLSLIEQTGFMNLDTTYGGAGENQRYYTHKISVVIGEQEKRVFYQSFPGSSAMPEAFQKVKDKLSQFINEKFSP